jgi:tetratricopeptide (TPR) repeat protein
MRNYLRTILLLVVSLSASAQNEELTSIFEDANRLYLEQKFDAAASRYEAIIKNGYENGEVYFNLGNAYYKSGKLQRAILSYERARKFIANDEDLDFNIRLVNLQLQDKIEAIPELFHLSLDGFPSDDLHPRDDALADVRIVPVGARLVLFLPLRRAI